MLVIALIGVVVRAPTGPGAAAGPAYRADPAASSPTWRVLPPLGIVIASYVFWAGADPSGRQFGRDHPRGDDAGADWPELATAHRGAGLRAGIVDRWPSSPSVRRAGDGRGLPRLSRTAGPSR